jgi:Tfp pilus assembly protein PilO
MSAARSQSSADASACKVYLAAGVVCAAISFGAYWVGVRPALAQHEEQTQRQVELQAARHKAANLVGARNAALAQVAAVNAELNNLPLRLEPASTVNHRLAALTALIKDCKLGIDKTRAGAPVDAGDYQAVPIVITGTGTYPAVARFLHKVRTTFPDTAVRSFETANNSASAESPTATFQFDLVWHAAKG